MQQNGVINILRQRFIGDLNRDASASKIEDLQGLGYDRVVLPFLALLIGVCAALLQLVIEILTICKMKCSNDEEQSKEDNSTSEEAKEMIYDINNLLLDHHHELGGMKFLSKIRTLALPDA